MISGGEHYALEVKGDSMIEAGIFEGDTVIIRHGDTATPGEIVVALVDGEEANAEKTAPQGRFHRARSRPTRPTRPASSGPTGSRCRASWSASSAATDWRLGAQGKSALPPVSRLAALAPQACPGTIRISVPHGSGHLVLVCGVFRQHLHEGQPRPVGRARAGTTALPDIGADVVVIAAARQENRLRAVMDHRFQPEFVPPLLSATSTSPARRCTWPMTEPSGAPC